MRFTHKKIPKINRVTHILTAFEPLNLDSGDRDHYLFADNDYIILTIRPRIIDIFRLIGNPIEPPWRTCPAAMPKG